MLIISIYDYICIMENCIHCGSKDFYKHGKPNGVQLYHCNNCKKYFTEGSNPKRGLVIEGKKYCSACDTFKSLDEFLYSQGKPRSKCKLCFLIKNKSTWRYTSHNLTKEEFNLMLTSQNNKCAICHNEFKVNRNTFIDHDHATGKIRKLLCPKCNMLLGGCNDNIETLKSAILYLEDNQ